MNAVGTNRPCCGAYSNAVDYRMALQLHHRVVDIQFHRQEAALRIALEEPSFFQESRYTMTDGMHQGLEFIDVGRLYPVKTSAPIAIFHIHPVEDQHLEIYVAA